MKFLIRLVAALLFIVFFGFALQNTDSVVLHLFWGYELGGPLVLMLLGFAAIGAFLGVLAMAPTAFRQRREMLKLQKTLQIVQDERASAEAARHHPPQPDSINSVARTLL
jgi:putative membrane protein